MRGGVLVKVERIRVREMVEIKEEGWKRNGGLLLVGHLGRHRG